jgi:GAF domain-containing protein/HAMP domain-containing protein
MTPGSPDNVEGKRSICRGGFMLTNPTSRSQGPTTQQARNARRVAILVMVVLVPSLVVFGLLAYQLAAWQMAVDTGIMFAYGVATLVGLRLIQRGRVALGMQIILFGMGLGLLALNLLIAGFGVLLGITTSLLITVIANLTLPEPIANPIIVVAFGLGLLIVLLDALLPGYRLSVPELNTYVPVIVVVVAVGCFYLIAQQFRTYSIRSKLTLTLLLVAILPLILQAVAYSWLAQSRLTDIAQQSLLAAAKQTAGRIDRFIKDGLLEARASARLPDVIDFLSAAPDQRNPTKVAAILDALSSKGLYIRSYAVFDTHGINLFDTSRLNMGIDDSAQPYVQTPLQTGETYVSWVIFDQRSGEGLVHISAPIRSGSGVLIGVMRVAYSIGAFQDLVAQAKDLGGNESFGILLDENHFRVADGSTSTPSFKSVAPLSPELLATLRAAQRVPDVDEAQLSADLPKFEAGLAQAETQPFFVAEAGETIQNAESQHVPDQLAVVKLAERPWLMVFGQTQQALLTPVKNLEHSSLFLVLAISAITLLVAARISQTLARPIASLNITASKVAQGDLSARAVVETNDEIGALAATFNSMTTQLRGLIGSLEERVNARTEQLRASADVGRAASSILDVDQLLRQAVSLISDRFGFYYAAVFMLDAAGEYAVLREATGEAGRILKERGHKLAVDNKSMVGATIQTRRARIALDVGKEAIRFANPLLPNTRSEIALPLIVGQRVIGALDVQSEQSAVFDDTSAEMLQTMAEQIAVALQNAELFDRSEQQARTLTVLNQMSRDFTLATTLDRIARITAQAVTQLVGASHIILAFKSSNPELLNVHRVFSDQDTALGEAQTMPATGTLVGHALNTGQTFHASNLADYEALYQDAVMLVRVGIRSVVSVPLRAGERILGALNVGHSQSTPLTSDQVAQLEQVASQMAIALENFNLAEQTRQALSELDAANRRLIGRAWEAYSQSTGQFSAEWRDGLWIKDEDGKMKDENRDVIANSEHLQHTPSGVQVSPTSNLQLPIKVRGQMIGEFDILTSGTTRDWTADDLAFAQALIDQVGQMIENARLLEETERLAQRERTINEINSRVRQTIDLDAILKTAVNELGQSLKAARVFARIGVAPGESDPTSPAGNGRGDNHA